MKKLSLLLSVILTLGVFVGCGVDFEPEKSALYIKKDGSIVEANIEDFDEELYSESELLLFVETEIEAYNEACGETKMKMESLQVENDVAKLFLNYASSDDYTKFHGEVLFNGSVAEAMSKGYMLSDMLYAVNKTTLGEEIAFLDVEDTDLKVVILETKVGVKVKGKIRYVSQNVNVIDKSTIEPKTDANGNIIMDDEYIIVIYK